MSEETQQPKFLIVDFECNGKKYQYNFDRLTANQIYAGMKYFKLDLAMEENLPVRPDEVVTITQRQVQKYAFAAILNVFKKDSEDFEKYLEQKPPAFDFLDEITGKDNFIKLMEIRQDFFYHTGLINIELTKGLGDLMKQLNGLSEIERSQVFKMMAMNQSDITRTKGKNSIPSNISETK